VVGDSFATIGMIQKVGAAVPLSLRGSWVPILHNVAWAEAYLRTKRYPDPSSRLATIDMGRKVGRVKCPFLGRVDGVKLRPI